jgi:hypothetical protein
VEPEKIVSSFPTLSIDQVRGAIAYYLENQDFVRRYLEEGERLSDTIPRVSEANPELYARLMAARARLKKQPA